MAEHQYQFRLAETGWSDSAAAHDFDALWAQVNARYHYVEAQGGASHVYIYNEYEKKWCLDGNEKGKSKLELLKAKFGSFMEAQCAHGGALSQQLHAQAVQDGQAIDSETVGKTNAERSAQALGGKYKPEVAALERLEYCRNSTRSTVQCSKAVVALLGIMATRKEKVVFNVGPEQHYNIQFNDCVYDLLEKKARPRTINDYVTQFLPFNFMSRDEISTEAMEYVWSFFVKIHPDEEMRTFCLRWLAYCMTGDTSAQVMKFNIGKSASNGKSTEMELHALVFSIYTAKFQADTFNKSNQKAHKQFYCTLYNPIRICYIEEINQEEMESERLKDFTSGGSFTVEIMHGTKETFVLQTKLMVASNADPKLPLDKLGDQGLLRRILCQPYESVFTVGVTDNTETNVYNCDSLWLNPFGETEYKMAYFYTLLMFLLPPGQLKPNIPKSTTEVFKEAVSLQDRIPDIVARYYVISGDHDDFIAKDDVQQYLDADLRAVGIKITPGTVIERLNKMEGVLYKKGKRTSDGRGAFLGLITLEEHYRREELRQQEEARLQYEADKLQRQKGNPLIGLYANKEQWIEMENSHKRKATEEAERLEAERLEAE